MAEDILGEQRLPAAGDGGHFVDGHAGADGGEGVPGEVKVGDGVEDEGVVVVQIIGEVFPAVAPDLRLADALHHFFHHVFGGHAPEVLQYHGGALFPPDARFRQILPEELFLYVRVGEGFRRQVGEVHHLRPVLPQQVAEGVVLLPGDLQVGDVVKQQALDILRHQVLQLPARPVEQHPPERADLAAHVNGWLVHAITPFMDAVNLPGLEFFMYGGGKTPADCHSLPPRQKIGADFLSN